MQVLGGLLRRIGNFDAQSFVSSFHKRIQFQKTVYLLQTFGIYLGYQFSWYLRGPYSPGLGKDGFDLAALGDLPKEFHFDSPDHETTFLDFLDFLGDNRNRPEWLELVSSIHFLKRLQPNLTKDQVISRMQAKIPGVAKSKCDTAWNLLEKRGFIESK